MFEVFTGVIGRNDELAFVLESFWKDDDKVYFFAIVVQMLVGPKYDIFLVFRSVVDQVFDCLIVVLEPIPEGVDFSHLLIFFTAKSTK